MSFCVFESDIVLCSGENVIIFNIVTNEKNIISLPKPEISNEFRSLNNEELDSFNTTTNIVFSKDGDYFAVFTNKKQLCFFHRKSRQLIFNRTLIRAASKITFTHKNDIIVADKSGDVYLYSTEESTKPGTLLLGHLSMLLDVLMTKDNKYIITTDRDEKIRVSMFPNSYNIVSYCLGHEKFVTNVVELPYKDILISGGGDGFFRFWNYKTGEEIQKVNFTDKFLQEDVKMFNDTLKKYDVDENEVGLPLKHLRVLEIDENSCIIIASFYCSKKIFIFKLVQKSSVFNINFCKELIVDNEPLECFVQKINLWILTDESIMIYEYTNNNFIKNYEIFNKLNKLNEMWKNLRSNVTSGSSFPILYKRRYDNVQEYQERKKIRLNKSVES